MSESLLQRPRSKFVRGAMAVAAGEDPVVAMPNVIRKERRLARLGTACARDHLEPQRIATDPQRRRRSVRALEGVSAPCVGRDLDLLLAPVAEDHHLSPNAFWSFVRSKPMIGSPSTTMTGTAAAPSFDRSSMAFSSSPMSRFVKGTPFAVRNSFTALHEPQVALE